MPENVDVWVVKVDESADAGVRTVRYGVADTEAAAAFAGMGGDTPLTGVAVTVDGSHRWRWAVSITGEPDEWLRHGTACSDRDAEEQIERAAAEWFSSNRSGS